MDAVLHSATKYLNGHTDLVAGAAIGGRDLVTTLAAALREADSDDPANPGHAAFADLSAAVASRHGPFGGLIASFLDAGELDEFDIHVAPVFIGKGIPLIAPRHRDVPLRLLETRKYPSGMVRLRYQVPRFRVDVSLR